MPVVDVVYFFFEVSQETKGEMTLQLTISFILNVYSLHAAAMVASGLNQKCLAQLGYFPFFPGVGHSLHCETQSDAFVWQQTDWPYNIYRPPATTTLLYLWMILVSLNFSFHKVVEMAQLFWHLWAWSPKMSSWQVARSQSLSVLGSWWVAGIRWPCGRWWRQKRQYQCR